MLKKREKTASQRLHTGHQQKEKKKQRPACMVSSKIEKKRREQSATACAYGQKCLFNSHLTPLASEFDCGVILGMKVKVNVK